MWGPARGAARVRAQVVQALALAARQDSAPEGIRLTTQSGKQFVRLITMVTTYIISGGLKDREPFPNFVRVDAGIPEAEGRRGLVVVTRGEAMMAEGLHKNIRPSLDNYTPVS